MADNVSADNSGNILVEFDYNNIIVVDPNKTIDAFGKIQERLVDHENLVMFANLEAEVVPRTKLAVGGSPEDRVRIISVAKINFLKPTQNNYLGVGYYDELTGENTTKYKGQNQMLSRAAQQPEGGKGYIINQPDNLKDVIDNGLLGITQINITTNTSFIPSVKIELEDVQGKALFQLGNNSPYAAFFNLPYPPFYLTLKGFYGQAVRYQLNLEKFNARFNSISGNYQVSLEFRGYKFNILNEIAMGHLLAVPHMYGARFNVTSTPVQAQQNQTSALSSPQNNIVQNQGLATSSSQAVTQIVTKKGYQKIQEVYSEYKAKALIPPDFPELTLVQLMNKLENFEKNIVNSFPKAEVEPLTNIRSYKKFLKQYFDQVRAANNSWFNKFCNPRPLILKNKDRVYIYKSDLDLATKDDATAQLQKIVQEFTKVLADNATLGVRGPSPIPNQIKFQTISIPPPPNDQIDWVETTTIQTGAIRPTEAQVGAIQAQYKPLFSPNIQKTPENQLVEVKPNFFVFEGNGRYDKLIASMETQANKKLSEYEAKISDKLLEKLQDAATGIGFRPTVRGIMAVIMASAEAFIRLLDDVHTSAWNVKYDPIRKNAILENPGSAPGSDTRDNVKVTVSTIESNTGLAYSQIPVYPWPQFYVETPEDKKGRFQLKYIADPTVVDLTQGYLYDKWPEVEFVEEYMVGITQKFDPPAEPPPLDSDKYTNTLNINAIEFPNLGLAYANKEEIKFFYEIWERQFLTSRYSNLVRANRNQIDNLIKLNIETEVNNIVTQLGLSSPYLTLKLKNYDLNSTNYVNTLSNISNMGTGRAYQDFIRDFFVTPYIRNMTENSFGLLNAQELGRIPQVSSKSDALRSLLVNASNQPLVIDTLPYTDTSWSMKNLADGEKSTGSAVYNTNKTLTVFEPRQIISNFTDVFNFDVNRPVTNFSYVNSKSPYGLATGLTQNQVSFSTFFRDRKIPEFTPTEGLCFYESPSRQLPLKKQTSILNTPYFVNSILNGVSNNRRNDPYPFVQSAYLFLNSLPIATLREKYKKLNGTVAEDLDYISSCFKKFGAIHKLPYPWILKLGSNWHRYKRYKETGIDLLRSAWTNFDYLKNYSPIQSAVTQNYQFKYNNKDYDVVLQQQTNNKIRMTVGFYPKLINDFNYFYTGYDLYSGYTNQEIQSSISLGMKVFSFEDSNFQAKQQNNELTLSTLSVLLPQLVDDEGKPCNTTNNTVGLEYFVVPSFGSQINQTEFECLTGATVPDTTVVDITSNPSVFNGSVRGLWGVPNYGYFDSNQIAYPDPESYVNLIDPKASEQTPMSLLNVNSYSKIEEIFSVFEKRVLDLFEDEFLKFCKPLSNAEPSTTPSQFLQSTVTVDANFRNFQGLFKSMMTVPAQPSKDTDQVYFQNTINNQYVNFHSTVRAFMEYDVIFKFGNPSNYRRRILDSYISYLGSSQTVTDPITFTPYVPNSLPRLGGGVSLQQSQNNNQLAWRALETEVGFSTIPSVSYTSNGSYITDFFIDNNIAFTQQNVVILSPIIKMWATQKLLTPSLTPATFKNRLQLFLKDETSLQDFFLDTVLTEVRKRLPEQQQLPEGVVKSAIQGEQSKVENYEVFKALNDKWIAGADYKTKTLFEDIMFLDRASRNIGETILIDIFDLKNMFSEKSLNQAMSVFTFMSGILIKNNFTVMNLPSYVNFYNIQDVDGTNIPQPEGSLQFANNMWGTFLDVDYRNSGPRMICFYVGKPSQYLDLPKGNFRFRDDGFEMIRASENPLIENQKDKKDWALSNRCVGFNVDIGTRNQNIFYSFQVSQDAGVATSEAINTQINMVDQASGRNTATQNVSLYNLYKNRSYKCSVVSLGNALIQPTMYFNLRHVPMFNGPYMITEVQHTIQPGNFQTSFNGIRQGIYDLPAIDNFLQSINQNLLTKLEELLKIEKDNTTVSATTNNQKASEVVQKSNNQIDAANTCVNNVDVGVYPNYTVTGATETKLSPEQFANVIKSAVPGQDDLAAIIYTICYVKSFVENGNSGNGNFVGFNNNFANISLYNNFSQTAKDYFSPNFCCIRVKATSAVAKSEPLVAFKDAKTFVEFMAARLKQNVERIAQMGIAKYYVCHWPKQNVAESYYNSNKSEFQTVIDTIYKALDSANSAKLVSQNTAKDLKKDTKNDQKNITPTPRASGSLPPTPTPTPVIPYPGQSCQPPVINSFAPLSAYTGTIIQINGYNFENVTGVTINNTVVNNTGITKINSSTIRVSVPKVGQGNQLSVGNIVLGSEFGNSVSTTLRQFTFDPALSATTSSSPGSFNNATNPASSVNNNNTNPQNSGPTTMIGTAVQLDASKTQSLNVKINPQATGWILQPTVEMTYVVYELVESNGTVQRKQVSQSSLFVSDQVVNNEFNVNLSQVQSYLPSNLPKIEGKTQIDCMFICKAYQGNQAPVVQQFPFKVWYTLPNQQNVPPVNVPANQTGQTLPPKKISLVPLGQSQTLFGPGNQYFNIKKNGGGYIGFVIRPEDPYENSNFVSWSVLNANSYAEADVSGSSIAANYSREINVNGLGAFRLQVLYKPYGNQIPNTGGNVLVQTILSDVFTL